MKFTSQISRFNSYLNGETPYVKNGNWWIGDTDTGVAAQAVDGVSFSGIVEYYFATLATDVDASGTPNAPKWDKAIWFTKIQDTKFGTKDSNGVTYKYLWNVEIVKSTSADGKVSETVSDVELFLTHNDSRIPTAYISYYAASTTSIAPDGYPTLGENNNFISGPDNSIWKKEDDYTSSTDESAFLFEISFVKYAEKDEKGHNLYALLSGPSMIGHNGTNGPKGDDAVTYSLSVIPNSWNKSVYPNISPSFIVTQYVGSEIVEMQGGYIIKVGETIWDNGSIAEDTTFDLYVNDILVDSETITAISDGADGKTPQKDIDYFDGSDGTDGDTVSTVYAFYKTSDNSLTIGPTSTPEESSSSPSVWCFNDLDPDDTYNYTHRSQGTKIVSGVDGTITYGNWQEPELWKAYHQNVPFKNYAEYLKITNFGASGLYYDSGKLYINADHIKVTSDGSGDTGYVVFEASGSSSTISMAGFTVDRYGLYNNKTVGLYANGRPVKNGSASVGYLRIVAGGSSSYDWGGAGTPSTDISNVAKFAVTSTGFLYAANAKIVGSITTSSLTATGGTLDNLLVTGKVYLRSGNEDEHEDATYYISANVDNTTWYIYLPSFRVNDTRVHFGGSTIGNGIIMDTGGTSSSTSIGGSSGTISWSLTIGKSFGVTAAGVLYATGVNISGEINATGGYIGGWELNSSSLFGKVDSTYCGMQKPTAAATKVFYAGATSTTGTSAKFYVQNDGWLYANYGTLAEGCWLGPSMQIGTWALDFTALYSGSAINTSRIGAAPSSDTAGLLIAAAEETACAINCRGTANQSYMNSRTIVLETHGTYKESVEIISSNPKITLSDNGTCGMLQGRYANSRDNLDCQYYSATGQLALGQMSYANQAIIISGAFNDYQVATKGTWSGSISGSSDYRLKKNIGNLSEKYDDFFNLLSPSSFEFYQPSDNRDVCHVGFIAQEVLDAIKWAGLAEREWGGLTTYIEQDAKYYALTYTEFIALNTWQIQKLKPRMTTAEQEIEKLKLEIAQLREELKNLQKS